MIDQKPIRVWKVREDQLGRLSLESMAVAWDAWPEVARELSYKGWGTSEWSVACDALKKYRRSFQWAQSEADKRREDYLKASRDLGMYAPEEAVRTAMLLITADGAEKRMVMIGPPRMEVRMPIRSNPRFDRVLSDDDGIDFDPPEIAYRTYRMHGADGDVTIYREVLD